MIDVAELKKQFRDKLEQSSSLDDAFLKSVWVAYKKGLEDGQTTYRTEVDVVAEGRVRS